MGGQGGLYFSTTLIVFFEGFPKLFTIGRLSRGIDQLLDHLNLTRLISKLREGTKNTWMGVLNVFHTSYFEWIMRSLNYVINMGADSKCICLLCGGGGRGVESKTN